MYASIYVCEEANESQYVASQTRVGPLAQRGYGQVTKFGSGDDIKIEEFFNNYLFISIAVESFVTLSKDAL